MLLRELRATNRGTGIPQDHALSHLPEEPCGRCQRKCSRIRPDLKQWAVLRKPHKIQRSTGRFGKCLKANETCGIRIICSWIAGR